jgi:2-dehydro-3-deoxy-D-pentonate aldolase
MFNGVIVPSVTLLQRDGTIDVEENRRHVDYLIRSGVDGIYILGTTGEFMHFNLREREGFAAAIVEHVDGRLPVIIGAASTATRDAVRLCRHAQGIGAAAVTVTTPYFWTLSEREVIGHFASVASAVDIPILAYNVPSYSGIDISNEILVSLAKEHPNIVGVIDAVDGIERARSRIDTAQALDSQFCVLAGMDAQILNHLELGGNGTTSATANIAPSLHVGIVEAFESGDYRAAINLYRRLATCLDIYSVEGSFHSVIKEAMILLGLASSSTVRLPALPLTPESRLKLRDVLTRAGLLSNVE